MSGRALSLHGAGFVPRCATCQPPSHKVRGYALALKRRTRHRTIRTRVPPPANADAPKQERRESPSWSNASHLHGLPMRTVTVGNMPSARIGTTSGDPGRPTTGHNRTAVTWSYTPMPSMESTVMSGLSVTARIACHTQSVPARVDWNGAQLESTCSMTCLAKVLATNRRN